MKITQARLKEIIKEEVGASLEDLEARMAAMDTRRDTDVKKVKHRVARDNLNEISRTLQLMVDLQNVVVRKKSKYFSDANTTIQGLPVQEMPAILELANITKEYAKHVKDEESRPMNERSDSTRYWDDLKYANDEVERLIGKIDSLGDEEIHGSTQGGPWSAMPVDRFIDGYHSGDSISKAISGQGQALGLLVRVLRPPVPQAINDRLRKEVKSGFLSNMHGLKTRYR